MSLLVLLLLAQAAPPAPPTPSSAELLKRLDATPGVKEQDKPFEIAASLGRLYVGNARYAEARAYYEQALSKAAPLRAFLTAQARAVGARALPAPGDVGCAPSAETTLAALLEKARAKAKAQEAVAALSCARAAWVPVGEVEVQYGNLLFVSREPTAALAAYERALATHEGNAEARYARAALLLDTRGDDGPTLKAVRADLERFLAEAPSSARAPQARRLLELATKAIAQGGLSKLPLAAATVAPTPRAPVAPPPLSPEVVKAFQDAPRTPEQEAGFARLIEDAEEHLARHRYEEARQSYLKVMPYQPQNPRLRAGMAWTMLQLNRQPMADNVWRAALENPDAVDALGDTLKAKGDVDGARAVWGRLQGALPSYAPRLQGKL